MKRTLIILTVFTTLSLACSLGGLIGGGDDTAAQNEPPSQSEDRCGNGAGLYDGLPAPPHSVLSNILVLAM